MEQNTVTIYPSRLYSVREMGLSNPEPHVDRAIDEFLKLGEGVAARWIQMPKGVLLFQVVPDKPDSGAIYLYDRERQEFFLLEVEGSDEHLTLDEFLELVSQYDLLRYVEQPGRLRVNFQEPGTA
jgi:hypothetical protein